ncbi:MAG: bifunctional phosphopantothenoylcysteine decarboxylase/phosphopantothenate--cysteine ligase CoaBC, partial [Mariprofundus sp.]|nr:bifunctional phosphopantothenoylcysteine decarboxylase/phosphopantothenate--cysteine ligase CoaBC [Mariprofundus sp.]
PMLNGKNILIGIGGGIAVYKVAELARMLTKAGADVRCVMTRSAREFVTPMTFEALTGNQVHTELFDLTCERQMGHIALARQADAVIIAPATASLLARLAHGIADDLLTTLMLVCEKPVLLAPAMNTSMWESAATQHNIKTLQQRGMHSIGPATGELACGERGEGRLADTRSIVSALLPLLTQQNLQGQHWVINGGPTVESWDAVRILSSRASGMLGALLADLAVIRGARVSFIAGPGTPETHPQVSRRDVESAAQMMLACEQAAISADVFIGTAAVSDYRFSQPHTEKLKRGETSSMTIKLTANPDIIARIAAMDGRPTTVIAFAAESSNHIEYARAKLVSKRVDAVVANDVSNMGNDTASGWWLSRDDESPIASQSKLEFAEQIINHIMELKQ